MSDPVLAVEQIGFNYGAKQALSEVTFSLSPGAYYALLGPNGAGKDLDTLGFDKPESRCDMAY